jgi:hypothetical protein
MALAKLVPEEVAGRVEEAAFMAGAQMPASDAVKAYKMKMREILMNLKSNAELLQSLRILPCDFALFCFLFHIVVLETVFDTIGGFQFFFSCFGRD